MPTPNPHRPASTPPKTRREPPAVPLPTQVNQADEVEATIRSPRPRSATRSRLGAETRRPSGESVIPASVAPSISDSNWRIRLGSSATHAEGFAKFDVGKELGRGGMGRVNIARDRELRRELAIKVLTNTTAEGIAQFVEEAQITGQLEHPNIIPVYELGVDTAGRPWMAMKRVRGKTLYQRIEEWRRAHDAGLSPAAIAEILAIFDKICDAVAFAHSHHVIHRDLKPENIMVGSFGEVLVMDWGLAKPLGKPELARTPQPGSSPNESPNESPDSSPASTPELVQTERRETSLELTLDGTILGTPAYMAPEQAEGRGDEVDTRTDIFNLGAMLFHMLTGEAPYQGKRLEQVLVNAAMRNTDSPAQRARSRRIPRELDAIVMKAMAGEATERYGTVPEMQADLRAFTAFMPVSAHADGIGERLVKWARRHPMTTMAGAVGSVLVVLFVAVLGIVWSTLAAQAADERLRAAEAKRETAEAERKAAHQAQVAAEAHAQAVEKEAENQRLAAENREARLRDLAQQGQIDRLRDELGLQVYAGRDAALTEFAALIQMAWENDWSSEQMVAEWGPARIMEMIRAYDRLFDAHEKFGLEVTAEDYGNRGFLRHLGPKDLAGALADYTRSLDLKPDLQMPRANRAAIHEGNGDFSAAIADYSFIIGQDATQSLAWHGRGVAKNHAGDLDGAIEDLTRAIALLPSSAEYHYARGTAYSDREDFDLALADFSTAIELDPNHAQAYYNRGTLLLDQEKYDGAIADFTRAVTINPRYLQAYFNRGRAHSEMENYQAAMADYGEAIAIDPTDPTAHVNRAVIFFELNNYIAAHVELDRATKLNPNLWQAYAMRGVVFSASDRDQARRAFDQALRIAPPSSRETVRRMRAEHLGE